MKPLGLLLFLGLSTSARAKPPAWEVVVTGFPTRAAAVAAGKLDSMEASAVLGSQVPQVRAVEQGFEMSVGTCAPRPGAEAAAELLRASGWRVEIRPARRPEGSCFAILMSWSERDHGPERFRARLIESNPAYEFVVYDGGTEYREPEDPPSSIVRVESRREPSCVAEEFLDCYTRYFVGFGTGHFGVSRAWTDDRLRCCLTRGARC